MNEAVDRLIMERERLDDGLSSSVAVSVTAHAFLIAGALLVPLLMPEKPMIQVAEGFTVPLPRGGRGVPAPPQPKPQVAEPPPPEPAKVEEPAPAPPPTKVLKPPTEAPRPNALPEPDSRRRAAPRREPAAAAATPKATPGPAAAATPGLEFAPAGPGVPGGTESGGDWYLATVQQKIWLLWNQQIRTGFDHPVGVTFTILADGNVADVKVTQSSGAALLDMAAQRAIFNAAPFAPLPREYGTKQKTIQAVFRPTE